MNILLDTNIIIDLNDLTKPLDPRLAQMQRLLDQLSYHIFLHPAQIDDFKRDTNEYRKAINLSRVEQYNYIDTPPIPVESELRRLNWTQNSDNDRIDNLLLYALLVGAIHILVSNDNGLHRKAKRAGLQDRVHRLEQFIIFLETQSGKHFNIPLGIEEKMVYALKPQATFWDSLKREYSEFEAWFSKVAQAHRRAWCVCATNGEPLAVCIYKTEDSPVVLDDGTRLYGKVLKLCTFKVDECFRGRKLGERLLYTAFHYAFENNYEYLYIQVHRQDHLIDLCYDFGFSLMGQYQGDEVLVKRMTVPQVKAADEVSALEFARLYYPHFRNSDKIRKFIVPIQPAYHEELFPDISDDSEGLFAEQFILANPHSNTIKKAYVSHARITKITSGDILLFFRTRDRKSIQVIGIVEQVLFSKELAETIALVSKRTVFSKQQLEKLLEKPILIILFRLMKYIAPISHKQFKNVNIKEPIQTIREISSEAYEVLQRGPR